MGSNHFEASDFFSGLSLQLLKLLHNCEDHFHFYTLSAVHVYSNYMIYIMCTSSQCQLNNSSQHLTCTHKPASTFTWYKSLALVRYLTTYTMLSKCLLLFAEREGFGTCRKNWTGNIRLLAYCMLSLACLHFIWSPQNLSLIENLKTF